MSLVMNQADLSPVNQAIRVADDSNKFSKEKFIMNEAKEFVVGVNPVKNENWINNKDTTFNDRQVPHWRKSRLATTMLQEAYPWWQSIEKSTYTRREITSITWSEHVTPLNEQYICKTWPVDPMFHIWFVVGSIQVRVQSGLINLVLGGSLLYAVVGLNINCIPRQAAS